MFSIIIPTFNNIQYLKKCIESIRNNSTYNHEIIPHVNEGSDGTIDYLKEKQALGTAGSLAQLKNKTQLPILVSNCDVISEMSYLKLLDFHIKKKADITVVIKEHQSINPFGQIKIKDSKILNIVEKPISLSYINAGIYVLNPKILNYIKKNQSLDMNGLIAKLLQKKKKIIPYPITDKWSDVSEYLKK